MKCNPYDILIRIWNTIMIILYSEILLNLITRKKYHIKPSINIYINTINNNKYTTFVSLGSNY